MGRKRRLVESIQDLSGRSGQRIRHDRCNHRQSPPAQRRGSKKGDSNEAIGRSRGGLITKIHTIVDALGNPLAVSLTGGYVHDVTQAQVLTQKIEPAALLADKGYDSDGFIEHLEVRPHQARHSAEGKSQDAARVRLRALLRAQPRGTFLQHHQALSRHRNPLRKDCQKLPRRRPPRLRPGLAQMTTGPRPRARSAPLYRWIWLTLSFVSRRSSALPRWSRHYNSQIGRIRLWRTYSPKLGAGKFLELRHDGVLGNSPTHDCGRISSIKPELLVGQGPAGVLEHVLGEHALDRLGGLPARSSCIPGSWRTS